MIVPGIKQITWLYHEFGLSSLYDTGKDAWLIIFTRCLRMFAYGTNSLIIALFFNILKFSDFQIGLFMTLTLLGDVALSFFLTLVADKIGRRRILLAGAFLMVLSGATFALAENFYILLVAAVVGVISATGSEIGPFRAVEESTISHLTTPSTRSDVLAWYVTTAAIGTSIGTEVCGQLVQLLQSLGGWTLLDAYHTVFWIYSLTGAINMGLILLMSEKCEQHVQKTEEHYVLLETDSESEDEQMIPGGKSNQDDNLRSYKNTPRKAGVFAHISPESRGVMYKMCALFAMDSLGGGMSPWSLINYYLDLKFHVSSSTLGTIASVAFFISAMSTLFASPLARRIGLINTMVFTHLPASIATSLLPAPPTLAPTVGLLFFRSALANMDQAPRAAFVAAVVRPEERTAVMGVNSMLRTLAQSLGPSITGLLAGGNRFWLAFVVAGILKASYDGFLWQWSLKIKLHQYEK
ncbi:MFS general substrate transporter [Microthyrium microscopicum]|uniref:MFS general substrate transporter n=1 Tax=Microthyrium microscopicum TaxID=703497 RepID=A0A6A6ULC2_9PEZI|nr:MFS general substrate transporter [Microthyrium microscopicum]